MALFNCCNGLVGRVARPGAMSAGPPAPATGPRTNGGGLWRGAGAVSAGLGGACSKFKLFSPTPNKRRPVRFSLFVAPPPRGFRSYKTSP
jgi:hypothetical protein